MNCACGTNPITVSEEAHSTVLRFTFHVLPFTVLERDFFSILIGVCYTCAIGLMLTRLEGHA
jgi:hypothetical protein